MSPRLSHARELPRAVIDECRAIAEHLRTRHAPFSFVHSLVEDMTSFLLGGRAWVVQQVSHEKRTVIVQPAPRGKKPSWGRFAPKMLSYELCQRIRKVLTEESTYGYVHEDAWQLVEAHRADYQELLRRDGHAVQIDDGDRALWWTFAGGRINHTLKYAIAHTTGWKVVADNFRLRFEGDGITHGSVERAILELAKPELWEDLDVWQKILAAMPVYRLSKFQPALPIKFQREMVGRYLLDIAATRRFLSGDGSDGGAAELLRAALERLRPVQAPPPIETEYPKPEHEVRFIADVAGLRALCDELLTEKMVALDVETTLVDRDLCLIQLGTDRFNALIDVLAIDDLTPIADVLESSAVLEVIHNATFERSVLQKMNMQLTNVLDTLKVSREVRGRKTEGGHSLAAVCRRELGRGLNKGAQTSDWKRRPLSDRQVAYAALDVEVLLELARVFAPRLLM